MVGTIIFFNTLPLLLIFVFLLLLFGVFVSVLRIRYGNDQKSDEEESRLFQELYHGLGRMERRVEALETLLLERERKEAGRDA